MDDGTLMAHLYTHATAACTALILNVPLTLDALTWNVCQKVRLVPSQRSQRYQLPGQKQTTSHKSYLPHSWWQAGSHHGISAASACRGRILHPGKPKQNRLSGMVRQLCTLCG